MPACKGLRDIKWTKATAESQIFAFHKLLKPIPVEYKETFTKQFDFMLFALTRLYSHWQKILEIIFPSAEMMGEDER